jgi:hypothetical protein
MPHLPLKNISDKSYRSIIVSAATGPDDVMTDSVHILQWVLIAGIPILFFVGTWQAKARQDLRNPFVTRCRGNLFEPIFDCGSHVESDLNDLCEMPLSFA